MSRFQYLPGGQWSFIEEMFSRRTRPKGRLFADARLMVEGIVYRYRYRYRYRAGIAGRGGTCQPCRVRGGQLGNATRMVRQRERIDFCEPSCDEGEHMSRRHRKSGLDRTQLGLPGRVDPVLDGNAKRRISRVESETDCVKAEPRAPPRVREPVNRLLCA